MITDISKDEENSEKDVIVLKKKLVLNQIMDFVLRCLYLVSITWFMSMMIVEDKIKQKQGKLEFTATKFFIDSMIGATMISTSLLYIYLMSFA